MKEAKLLDASRRIKEPVNLENLFLNGGASNNNKGIDGLVTLKKKKKMILKQGKLFDQVTSVQGLMYSIMDYLLEERDPIVFGSASKRLKWCLVNKSFASALSSRMRAVKTSRFYAGPQQGWENQVQKSHLQLRNFPSLPTGYLQNTALHSLHLKNIPLSSAELEILGSSRLKELELENCMLGVVQYTSHGRWTNNGRVSKEFAIALSFDVQVLQTLARIPVLKINLPKIIWLDEMSLLNPVRDISREIERFHEYIDMRRSTLISESDDISELTVRLADTEGLGLQLHVFTYLRGKFLQKEGSSPTTHWHSIEFAFDHIDLDSSVSHHAQDAVPTILSPGYFRKLRLPVPNCDRTDRHMIVWTSLKEVFSNGKFALIDRIQGDTMNGYIYQEYDSASKTYYALASPQTVRDDLNVLLMSHKEMGYYMPDWDL
jgi:hypothetical protein